MTPYLGASVLLLAWCVLPGLAVATLGCRGPGVDSARRFLTLALTSGLSVWFLGSEIIVRVDALTDAAIVTVGVGLALVSVVVLAGPGRSGLRALWSRDARLDAAFATGASFLASLPLLRLLADRRDSLLSATPWYYWRLARDVVAARGVPSISLEWASRLPFLDDYPGFTAGSAMLAVASGRATSLAAMHVVRIVALLSTGIACYLFARSLDARRWPAALAVVLLMTSATFVLKLSSYRPEGTGYALVFLVAALAKGWLDDRRNADLAVGAVGALALSQVHGIDWVLAGALVAGLVAAAFVLDRDRREVLRRAGVLAGALLVTWLAGNAALAGGLSGAEKLGGLPKRVAGVDPTWQFRQLTVGVDTRSPPPSMATVARTSLRGGFAGLGWGWYLAAAFAVTAAVIFVAWRGRGRSRRAARRYLIVVAVAIAVVIGISLWFVTQWPTDVPRRTGFARLLPLVFALLPVGLALALSGSGGRRTRVGVCVAGTLVVLAAFLHALPWTDSLSVQQPPRDTLGALRDLRLGPRALVLTNSYSEGFVPDVTGARGVLDGRAPYTERANLARANRLLRASIRFFAEPINRGGARPLPAAGVTHVLVSTGRPWALGSGAAFPADVAALDRREDLRLVRAGPGFRLYAVRSAAS